jgi:hypothetical protein
MNSYLLKCLVHLNEDENKFATILCYIACGKWMCIFLKSWCNDPLVSLDYELYIQVVALNWQHIIDDNCVTGWLKPLYEDDTLMSVLFVKMLIAVTAHAVMWAWLLKLTNIPLITLLKFSHSFHHVYNTVLLNLISNITVTLHFNIKYFFKCSPQSGPDMCSKKKMMNLNWRIYRSVYCNSAYWFLYL